MDDDIMFKEKIGDELSAKKQNMTSAADESWGRIVLQVMKSMCQTLRTDALTQISSDV